MKAVLLAVAIIAASANPCRAAPATKSAFGVVCDTIDQAARLHEISKGGAASADALEQVNAEAGDPKACVATMFFFFDGGTARDVGDALVIRVLVLAVMGPDGCPRILDRPSEFFSPAEKPGRPL